MHCGACVLFLLFWIFQNISIPARGDAEVSCVFMKSCILPCTFKGGASAVIHWLQLAAKDTPVHSYYHNQDQLAHQRPHFKGRTSLFNDQVSRGNASLQLRKVEVQDEGRYQCFTSTSSGNKESVINLKVDAPVDEIDIEQVENRVFCSSEGIYPEPKLSWSISPLSTVTEQNKPTILQNEQQLYNISSSLTFTDNATDVNFSCNISTCTNWRTATLKQLSFLGGSSSETTIPCTSSNTSMKDFSLVWRFNYSQIILNQTRANHNYTTSQNWKQKVKEVSASGSLTLKDLSPDQEGIYTCELSNNKETYKTNTHLMIMEGKRNMTA
uniref:Ig-like domain-containing protein n=1 Tax=Sphaeramia orbicularis TaxID=375764 RepID=A0A673CLQ6_9TELE